MNYFFFFAEVIGTIAFALSGALKAIEKKLDIFGICFLALFTALGGGVVRDLLLGKTPPRMFESEIYILIALFTVSLVHYLLARSGKLWWYRWIVPVCFVCYFFFTAGVYFFQPETSVQMRYMRNAWFFGLPCFGLGYLLAGIKWPRARLAQIIYGVLGVGFFALQMVEDSLWRTPNCKIEMYVSGVLAAVCLLQFFLCIRRAECGFYYKWIGKSAPFYVYILHMAVAVTLSRFVAMENLYLQSLAVFLISFVIYEAVYLGQMGVKHLRARKKTA